MMNTPISTSSLKILDPISLPLNQSNLIEASAGTGKTYTMVNLYLRLILGVDCEPLSVEQILVVTFTKAATQELRDRVRTKLGQVVKWFQEPHDPTTLREFEKDPFLSQLYSAISHDRAKAILRLRVAERDMDLASIFTIDSFCQKMLMQYAFDSGIRFDQELQTDESELLQRLSEEVWREQYYPASLETTKLVAQILNNPSDALEKVKAYLSGLLPPLSEEQKRWLKADNQQKIADYATFLAEVKSYWLANHAEIVGIVLEKLSNLNGNSYKAAYLTKWHTELTAWAEGHTENFKSDPLNRFTQSFLSSKTKKNQSIPQSPYFEKLEEFIQRFEGEFASLNHQIQAQIVYGYFEALREKLRQYKQIHTEKNFTDMLIYFHQALMGEKGQILAHKIRQQFKFAMIDESQDTNQVQYDIFSQIFMIPESTCGFIMIGDPKQSIYKFRGADIFSYLNASQQVADKYTLSKNWRSLPQVVEGVNQLFQFTSEEKSPFLYQKIHFNRVEYDEKKSTYLIDGKQAWNLYLQPNAYQRGGHFKSDLVAEQCAHQIQQQLSRAQQRELFISEEKTVETAQGETKIQVSRPIVAQDIAILVRSHHDAQRIKQALAKRHIRSVYLSENSTVYASQEAKDLAFILTACLYPHQQHSILAALATPLWSLNALELFQLKNSEMDWERYIEYFIQAQKTWQEQGILPMLHQFILQQGIIRRLNDGEDTDRRITNLLHLIELLQAHQEQCENEFALLRWFQQQILQPESGDEQILRLESEEKLIKIITIHKSKGLEYPIVWLPFVAKKSLGAQSEVMSYYRDADNQLRWDFNSDDETIKSLKNNAEYAEDIRLLYVALTRAKYQLHLILPTEFSSQWNAMHYLLTDGEIAKGTKTAEAFKMKKIDANIVMLDENVPPLAYYQLIDEETEKPQAREFEGVIRRKGGITSFSALQAQHERLHHFLENSALAIVDPTVDYDREASVPLSSEPDNVSLFTPHTFPRSSKVGQLLHKLFENWDFSQPLTLEEVKILCDQLHLSEEWLEPVQRWLMSVVITPFAEGISLSQFHLQKRLNEWQFYLRLQNENALPQLNRLLKKASPLAKNLPDLQLSQLEGFVKGFVDLIVEHQGKFYIIDYKSHYLGDSEQDYKQSNIIKCMGADRYDLQFLLYTLAVHRYLKSRLGENYDYDSHFGGVAYLFLRGMTGESNSGVYFEKPDKALIDEMDALFG